MKKNILVLGATSGIAGAFCRLGKAQGYRFILAGRNEGKLKILADDLFVRTGSAPLGLLSFDVRDTKHHPLFFDRVMEICPDLDGCFVACGVMFSQKECQKDFELCRETIETNYLGLISILNVLADFFEKKKQGFISCITSVAGDRGRGSNYIYGSAKAGLSVYLQGLRNRLHPLGILVQTVKAGPVDTAMTRGLKDLPFLVSPERVAKDILKGLSKRVDVLYTPSIWGGIMGLIRILPESIFKRLKL